MAAGAHRPDTRQAARRRTDLRPVRAWCTAALCGRRMQGNSNHGAHHYRCQFAVGVRRRRRIDHPKTVYVRESAIVPKLDEWLATLFDPTNLDATCDALAGAGGADEADHARIEAARRKLADCDERLAKYRKALEPAPTPSSSSGWMAEVQGERLEAERELANAAARRSADDGAGPGARRPSSATSRRCWPTPTPKLQGRALRGAGDPRHLRPDRTRVDRVTAASVYNCKCRRGDLNPHALAGTSPSSRLLHPGESRLSAFSLLAPTHADTTNHHYYTGTNHYSTPLHISSTRHR